MLFLDLETSCTSQALVNIFGIVGRLLSIICFSVPILLIISYIYKFTKLVQNPEEKNGIKKIITSGLALIIIFFIPIVVDTVMKMVGEKYNISSCWLLAKESRFSIQTEKYINIGGDPEKKNIISDSSLYENGVPRNNSSSSGGGITSATGAKLVEAARSQLGVPYHTMHYGPKGSGYEGFGCAMFVSYCYNQVFFGGVSGQDYGTSGFYGSTYEYWGNVTNDGYNPHNKKFVEVSASEAQAGDVVAYIYQGSNPYATIENCPHVALYIGNGRIIGSWGLGTSGPGVIEGDVSSQADGTVPHYLHYVGSN